MYPTDVDRHFIDLKKQLADDEVDEGSEIEKTLLRLEKALQKDGFSLAARDEPTKAPKTRTTVSKTTKVTAADSFEYVVQAFRVGGEVDAEAVASVFDQIEGWKTRTLDLKGRTFVVVTNAPRWSKKRIKSALSTLLKTGTSSISPGA